MLALALPPRLVANTGDSGRDGVGNLIWKTNFDGTVLHQDYDARNRLLRTTDHTHSLLLREFTYTATGRVQSSRDSDGETFFRYDDFDRLQEKRREGWGTVRYRYSPGGRLLSMQVEVADEYWEVLYGYDGAGRLAMGRIERFGLSVDYRRDRAGNLVHITYGNGLEADQDCDSRQRLSRLRWSRAREDWATFDYTINGASQRTTLVETWPTIEHAIPDFHWVYDSLGRLGQEQAKEAGHVDYIYDAVGNRQMRRSTITGVPGQDLRYDSNDRINSDADLRNENPNFDRNGSEIRSAGGTVISQYDSEQHLVERHWADRAVSVGYDAQGHRIARKVIALKPDGTRVQVSHRRYLVDDQNPTGYAQVVAEVDQGDEGSWRVRSVGFWGEGYIAVALRDPSRGVEEWEVRYALNDGHGSVRLEVGQEGEVLGGTTFDAYGIPIRRVETADSEPRWAALAAAKSRSVDTWRGYAGEEWDEELGLYYLRARYLDPTQGRFLTMDSYEGQAADPRSLHKYGYCQGDPINRVDPGGNADYTLTSFVTASAIAGGLGTLDGYLATRGQASGGQLAGAFVAGTFVGAGGYLVAPLFLSAGVGGKIALYSFGAAAGFVGVGKALSEQNPQLAIYRAVVLCAFASLAASGEGNVRVYRVEGTPNTRILVGDAGEVVVSGGEKTLFLNFGQRARAEEFLVQRKEQNMPGATIKSYEIPKSYLEEIRSTAVDEESAGRFPTLPIRVDTTKALDQFGLRAGQIETMISQIVQGSGRVE